MGTEYAIVDDTTGEAFDIGKGFAKWHGSLPASREGVRAGLAEWLYDEDAAHGDALTDVIWGFIEAHPGCVVKHDCGDAFWCTREITDDDRTLWTDGCYRQVGALWDVLTAARDRSAAK